MQVEHHQGVQDTLMVVAVVMVAKVALPQGVKWVVLAEQGKQV